MESYSAIIKLPIGKKPCTVTIERHGDGTYTGDFSVLGSTAPMLNGRIDEAGNFSCDCTITTILGTMEATAEGHVENGLIEGNAKCRMGVMEMKSKELWDGGTFADGAASASGKNEQKNEKRPQKKGLFARLFGKDRAADQCDTVSEAAPTEESAAPRNITPKADATAAAASIRNDELSTAEHAPFDIDPTLFVRATVPADKQLSTERGMVYFDHDKPYNYEEDGLTVTRGSVWSAPGCHLGCGVLIYSKDGRVVRVEGDSENPYNQGRLCARCAAVDDIVNSNMRVLYPMKRAFEDRGKDKWERITWDEALDTVERRFNEYKEVYGPESVAFLQGTGRDIAAYISRFAWSFGSPNYAFSLSNVACFGPRVFACTMVAGAFLVGDYSQQFIDRYDNPAWRCPGVTVVWGNNPVVANSDGAYGHWVTDVMQRGSKLLVIDSKLTWLASRADVWVQPRNGTDGALALGIANVLIQEDLVDHNFIDCWTYGYEEYAALCAEWTPERTAQVCWIDPQDVIDAARLIGQNAPALLQWGVALDQREDCTPASRAVFSVFAITGNIEKPGSMIVPPELLKYITGWGRELLSFDAEEKRIGTDELLIYKVGLQVASINKLVMHMAEQPEGYPIKASWIQTVNEIACGGVDNETTIRAFQNLEFNVIVDLFMTPTAMAFGDLFLPVTTYPERNGIRVGDGSQRGETINRAVPPRGECRSDMEINLELGRRWNPQAWPWDSVEDMFSHIVSETGMNFEEIRDVAPGYLPFEYNKHEKGMLRADGQPGFQTPTGRIELWASTLEFIGMDPLPRYEEPSMTPVSQPDLYKEYPLVLQSGARRHNTFHSENRQALHLRKLHPEPVIEMNPKDARKYGVADGQWVWVEGPVGTTGRVGRAKRVVCETPTVKPGMVSTDHGWWHPEGDPENLYDVNELNINNLLSWSTGATGVGANYKCMLCRVYACEGEE